MGFDLEIGEFKPYTEDDITIYTVVDVKLSEAPAYGHPMDFTNRLLPSETGWFEFAKAAGLTVLFNWIDGQIINRSAYGSFVDLTQEHKAVIDAAYENINKLHPDHHGRLEWLKFWVDWALTNCERPVFTIN